jgi:hypothetical protein
MTDSIGIILCRGFALGTSRHSLPHKHSPQSGWSKQRSLYLKARDELRQIYDASHWDPVTAETISLRESILLDVDAGEVLAQGLSYQRRFDDVLNRR